MSMHGRIAGCTLPGRPHDARFTVEFEAGRIIGIRPHDARDARGPGALDAKGRALLPGFIDAHAHVVEAGVERLRCDMTGARSAEETFAAISEYAASTDAPWIVGRGWELDLLPDPVRSLEVLDRITGDRPAYLNNANGHCAWANSAALRAARISASTPDPVGGVIGRDAYGALDGMLYESALNLVNDLIPPLSEAEKTAGLRAGVAELLSFGVTSWQEAIVGPYVQTTDVAATLREGVAAGIVPGHVEGAIWWPRGRGAEAIDEVLAQRELAGSSPRFRCDAVKIMLDGTAATLTAGMIDPYPDGTTGDSFFDPEALAAAVAEADLRGLDVHIHANGDRSVRDAVDAIGEAVRRNPPRRRRHQIAHLGFARHEDIRRMADLSVIGVVQPAWAHRSAKMVERILPRVSEGSADLAYPFGSVIRAGGELAFSSDWPVSPPDPWAALHGAVHRSRSGSVDHRPLGAAEAISVSDALRSATHGSARALRREDTIGHLAVGYQADLVLADRSWADAERSLEETGTSATLVAGEVVFAS